MTHAVAAIRPTAKPHSGPRPPMGATYDLRERMGRYSSLYRREAATTADAAIITMVPQQHAVPGCRATLYPLPWEPGFVPPTYQPPAETARPTTMQGLPLQWARPSRLNYADIAGQTAFQGPPDQWVGPTLAHQ